MAAAAPIAVAIVMTEIIMTLRLYINRRTAGRISLTRPPGNRSHMMTLPSAIWLANFEWVESKHQGRTLAAP